MRFVIYGAGAIGGTVAVGLHESGHDVAVIARGAHLDAIRKQGLTLSTPDYERTAQLPAFDGPAAAGLRSDDVILLCIKSQDTEAALFELRAAAGDARMPVVIMQNGVANERAALRLFANVYGCLVLMPTEHLEPGLVVAYSRGTSGCLDLGRYPHGSDDRAAAISAAFNASGFSSDTSERIMDYKYAKLLSNLGNGVEAICGPRDRDDPDVTELLGRLRQEGRTVLAAAEITADEDGLATRGRILNFSNAGEHVRGGGSTWQSVTRGTGSVETDYLNGEVVLLAREHSIPAPANELIQDLTRETAARGLGVGWKSAGELLAALDHD